MVMTVFNIQRMSKSSEVEGGGVAAAVGSTYTSAGSPVEEGGGGATPEDDSTLWRLVLALIWAAIYLRKVAPIGAIIWTGSNAGNSSKPKCNKIWWIQTGKNRPWVVELLLWTSINDKSIQKCTSL